MQRALCIGINYVNDTQGRLRGCANDAANLAALFHKLGYASTMMVDEAPTIPVAPGTTVQLGTEHTTRAALLAALIQLRDATLKEGVRAVAITFSGHGTQTVDATGDEQDGRDEMWVPSDYRTAGLISDDTLAGILSQFHPSARIFLISDACHSGTATDLPYKYDSLMRASSAVKTSRAFPCRIVHLSGCQDFQTSADAWAVEGQTASTGALTACFLSTIRERTVHCPVGTLMRVVNDKLVRNGFTQRSLMTSTVMLRSTDTLRLV